jgi:sulfur-oxidizing protein SoxX
MRIMFNMSKLLIGVSLVALMFISSASTVYSASENASRLEEGKKLAFDRKKGNCLACHMIADGSLPGNTAPPLVAMKARFPDFDRLVNQISNPLKANPNSLMPPFGLHDILSKGEITKIAEYLYTL